MQPEIEIPGLMDISNIISRSHKRLSSPLGGFQLTQEDFLGVGAGDVTARCFAISFWGTLYSRVILRSKGHIIS